MTDLAQRASHSVVVLHQQIEALFHGDGSQLATMLDHFNEDFEMVTPGGKRLALTDVAALFEQLTGTRQGMTITIEQCNVITQAGDEVVIQYRERQEMQGKETNRISLAVINCATQPPRWRYLQETMIA